ncbi:hypothetical protein AA0121_g5107 [Alternaria tenuissima]|nr:hypothetical protein AA0121_g5107 [Alternaria tenuissima]
MLTAIFALLLATRFGISLMPVTPTEPEGLLVGSLLRH